MDKSKNSPLGDALRAADSVYKHGVSPDITCRRRQSQLPAQYQSWRPTSVGRLSSCPPSLAVSDNQIDFLEPKLGLAAAGRRAPPVQTTFEVDGWTALDIVYDPNGDTATVKLRNPQRQSR